MQVLHAIWNHLDDGKLQLWLESSDLMLKAAHSSAIKKSNSSSKTVQTTAAHPFALNSKLHEALELFPINNAQTEKLTLQLPSTAKMPVPSPELRLDEDDETLDISTNRRQKVTGLKAWEIACLSLDAASAIDLLLALSNTKLASNLTLGSSVRFWAEAAKLSLELLARQNFVPTVHNPKAQQATLGPQAIWKAHLITASGASDERLALLAQAMPPLCRALVTSDAKPSLPTTIVRSFLDQTIDAFVRKTINQTAFLPKVLRPDARLRVTARALTPAEQWVQTLGVVSRPLPRLNAPPKELKTFEQELKEWLGRVRPTPTVTTTSGTNSAYRTCFKLDPPPDDPAEVDEDFIENLTRPLPDDTWQLSFYLQALDDRSLLVPAAQVWKERSSTLTFLKRQWGNPQERLLADLGAASRLYPPLEASLKTARPNDLPMTSEQAYEFLRQTAPLLEQSGFGVLLPNWWRQQKAEAAARLSIKLKLKPKKGEGKTNSGLLGLDKIVAYDWQVAVGEQSISPAEFEKLAKLKIPLVKIRGKWVELRPEDIEATIAFFQKKHAKGDMTLREALRLGLGGEAEDNAGLSVSEVAGEGWIKEFLDKLSHEAKIETGEQPAAFVGTLRPYQLHGMAWLAFLKQFGLGACLADDMGLGKSAELIALLLHEQAKKQKLSQNSDQKPLVSDGISNKPTLLISPMSVVGNWQREFRRFAPGLKVMVHHGAGRLAGTDFEEEVDKHDIVITTYALAQRDAGQLTELRWDGVVLDEAQNIKNSAAKQSQAIRKLKANYKVALTGTPVENRLSELWSIMDFLNPGYLGSAPSFRNKFGSPIEKYRDAEKSETLKRLIQPFVLRRVKTDKNVIQDLPDKLEMKVFCNLTQEQATLYEAVVKEMLEKVEQAEGIERKGLVLATLLKLKQVCNHPSQFIGDHSKLLSGRSGKLDRLQAMLEEVLAEGDKALIFTQFAQMGTLLRHYLQETFGLETLFLYGDTPKAQRDIMVERFQRTGRNTPQLFILSLKAGGVGLNLTAANHVFHFDRWWNPAVENQATDRAFRIGQKKNVQVHKFVCVGTLEERIDEMIEQKKGLAASIVGSSGENWITQMSTEQLKEMFTLSRDAVAD